MTKEVALKDLLQELAEDRGFDFRGYKRTTLERRFRKRMFQLNLGSYEAYGRYIREHPDEVSELLNTILINVTAFFRDPAAWEILRHEILPALLRIVKPGGSFRAWSAGCASGEEAYSVAILLSELLGPRIAEYDIKIYATDIDDEELTTARRGEYSSDALRGMRAEWREKYFHGKGMFRVNRDIRRLVIFGKSNLAQDAPISHVNLLLCRNVLIYFNSELQKQIMPRLHYALDPGGILFLGKSESQLTNSPQFRRLNARWRMFQRITPDVALHRTEELAVLDEKPNSTSNHELEVLRQQQRYLLETLRLGVLILAADDTVTHANPALFSNSGLQPASIVGRRLQDTDLYMRVPELGAKLQATRVNNESARFQCRLRIGAEERLLEITVRPMMDANGQRTGTFIYCDDTTTEEKLQTTVEELESTSEELQSANEELETTNEELQSTNEELETTNEELQSTNEELETTNEELQSLNEELETTNQELEERTKDLDHLNTVYAQTLEKIRLPVMLVNAEGRIEFWNGMALRMFGFRSKPPMELMIDQLPVPESLRKLIQRRHRSVLSKQHPIVARHQLLGDRDNLLVDVHFSVIPSDERDNKVLIMFEPNGPGKEPKRSNRPHDGNSRSGKRK